MAKKKSKEVPDEYGDLRTFRRAKRKDVREAMDAIDTLMHHADSTPASREIRRAHEHLQHAASKLSTKNWGD